MKGWRGNEALTIRYTSSTYHKLKYAKRNDHTQPSITRLWRKYHIDIHTSHCSCCQQYRGPYRKVDTDWVRCLDNKACGRHHWVKPSSPLTLTTTMRNAFFVERMKACPHQCLSPSSCVSAEFSIGERGSARAWKRTGVSRPSQNKITAIANWFSVHTQTLQDKDSVTIQCSAWHVNNTPTFWSVTQMQWTLSKSVCCAEIRKIKRHLQVACLANILLFPQKEQDDHGTHMPW